MSPNRVLEGDNVSLICNVSGNPHPNVAWVRASDNSVLINDSKAVLTNINRMESGVFHCLAWNGIGANASSNISIDVLCEYVFNKEDLKVTLVLIPSEVIEKSKHNLIIPFYSSYLQPGKVALGQVILMYKRMEILDL